MTMLPSAPMPQKPPWFPEARFSNYKPIQPPASRRRTIVERITGWLERKAVDNRSEQRVTVTFSAEELARYSWFAGELGITTEEWIRRACQAVNDSRKVAEALSAAARSEPAGELRPDSADHERHD
jgi:hypothetical protein